MYSLGLRESIQLSEDDYAIYAEALSDLTPVQLDVACLNAEQTCTFFPKPAEIRLHVDRAAQVGRQAEAQDDWTFALDYATRCYHVDIGISRNAPEVPPRIERAIRAAGGLHWLWGCREDQLQWAKKAFIESLTNTEQLEQIQDLLPRGSEARNILRRLVASAEAPARKTFAPGAWTQRLCEPVAPDDPVRAEFANLRDKIKAPEPAPEPPSVEEWENRRGRELARFNRYLQEHPELRGSPPSVQEHLVPGCVR